MIVVRLNGGLGNQLFQYAFGRALALRKSTTLFLDTSRYENDRLRKFSLMNYNHAGQIASAGDLAAVLPRTRLGRKIEDVLPYFLRSRVVERSFRYDPWVYWCRPSVYLEGYWQSERYFKSVSSTLRNDFKLKNVPHKPILELASHMQSLCSVSIHVRRGDYASNSNTLARHGLLSLDYYTAALALLRKGNSQKLSAFVFSDDTEWAKKNIRLDVETEFVDSGPAGADYLDLFCMSQCKHHIVANSSFSWWGAWLNPDEDKVVVAPKAWFRDNTDDIDLIPSSWHRI